MKTYYKHVPDFCTQAYTVSPDAIGLNNSGWFVTGKICEDYFTWVNDFDAVHPVYGRVCGNFETQVKASSKAAFDHFMKDHPPEKWDYYDI